MTTKIPRILLVDDDSLNLDILSNYLSNGDYLVDTAIDSINAWEMLESDPENYDVILLDRMMPDMCGMTILAKIKTHQTLKHCPVILQTALNDNKDILDGIRAGAYYYLTKPYSEELLISIVNSAVRSRMQYCGLKQLLTENNKSVGLMDFVSFHFQTIEQIKPIASFLAKACPYPEDVIWGLSELMINAVEHGNLGISYAEKTLLNGEKQSWTDEVSRRLSLEENKNKFVTVDFQRKDNEIEIIISDQGEGFDWEPFMELGSDRIGDNNGRGIAMAGIISFSRIEYRGKGNVVHAFIEY